VRRGDSVTVTLEVPAATQALLWTRGPGEPWRPAPVALDSLGRATRRIGPLESDLYLRATSGGRRSGERRGSVALAAFGAGLRLPVVPGSGPAVALPVPGRATTPPLSLRQPLVIDARDDHGLTRLEVVSWRVSRTGKVGAAVRESLDVSGAGERAIVQGDLDAERRGLLAGDTLRVRVEAGGNVRAPRTHVGRSEEIALRLPSLEECRAATRAAARDVAGAADSLAQAERELGARTRDLAQQRSRDAAGTRRAADGRDGPLPFQATERAQAVAREQEALQQRVQELS